MEIKEYVYQGFKCLGIVWTDGFLSDPVNVKVLEEFIGNERIIFHYQKETGIPSRMTIITDDNLNKAFPDTVEVCRGNLILKNHMTGEIEVVGNPDKIRKIVGGCANDAFSSLNSTSIIILGTPWTVKMGSASEYPYLSESNAFMDFSVREIVVRDLRVEEEEIDSLSNVIIAMNRSLRHEIIHAFLYESGLLGNSQMSEHWALNEEMVDWFAIQTPKIYEVFKQLDILDLEVLK